MDEVDKFHRDKVSALLKTKALSHSGNRLCLMTTTICPTMKMIMDLMQSWVNTTNRNFVFFSIKL